MMKFLLFLILTQYAVNCDDTSNYYVVEVPEDDPTTTLAPRAVKQPFRVYWNVPTMQCKSRKVLFNLDEYGIIQNKDDSFRGEKITILYDPGLFPALLKNESSGEFRFRNGGVPQQGNMSLHLEAFRATMEESIPDPDFSGVGIIDFESWRPVFRQNFGVLVPYKDVSSEIEKKLHWWWTDDWIQAEAKQRFEAAARAFMQTTLSVAKQMRPRALWGYYGFPYCFNMGANNKVEQCADNVDTENDNIYWLWSESTALFPSVYSSTDLSSAQLAALIRGRVKEANRVRRKFSPVLPYFWFRYRDGGYMSEVDLSTALKAFYDSNASGFIIWGSSNDVNTLDNCQNLLNYVQSTLGPAIAKYTIASTREEDEMSSTTEAIEFNTEKETLHDSFLYSNVLSTLHKINASVGNTTIVNTRFIPIDPEFPWEPPANYSQEISHYVEEELIKKDGYNETKLENELANLNNSLLMEIMIKSILNDRKNITENTMSNNITENKSLTKLNSVNYTTVSPTGLDSIASSTAQYIFTEQTYVHNMTTINPLDHINNNDKTDSVNDSNFVSGEEQETTEFVIEVQPTIVDNNIYTDTTPGSDELFIQSVKEVNSFHNNETLFNHHDNITDNAGSTTESLTIIANVTSIYDNGNILYDQKTGTETDELFSSRTDTTPEKVITTTESTNLITENIAEFITKRLDLKKQYKKEYLGFETETLEYDSTDWPPTEISELEQVVIYIT